MNINSLNGGLFMDVERTTNPVKILIVDDHPNTAAMLARVLSKFDKPVEILTASGGEEALKTIGDQGVDVLITDFMMLGMNGLELIEKLTGPQKPAHIILMTAYDTPDLAVSARGLNVQDYLVKPVQPERIRGIVGKAIERLRPSDVQKKQTGFHHEFKILVGDDNPDSLRLLSSRLQYEGYKFIPAWDGDETLAKIRSEKPDLVLLDVSIQKQDGFRILEEFRADPEISHIPVIIITAARIGPKDIGDGLILGVDDYVIKPYDWRELAVRIRLKLQVKKAEDILSHRNLELKTLQAISGQLTSAGTFDDIADTILSRINLVLDAVWARVDIFQDVGPIYYCVKCYRDSLSTSLRLIKDRFIHMEIISSVIASRNMLLIEDNRSNPAYQELEEASISSLAVLPLLNRNCLVGLLSVSFDRPIRFFPEQLALLQTIASQAALAVENIQNRENKSQIVKEMNELKTYLLEQENCSCSQKFFELLPHLAKQLSDGIS
jgi:DNA-binding response OmpR family regulator